MGKNLIIQGADFHENGIVTSILAIDRSQQMATADSITNTGSAPYADIAYPNLQGKTIRAIEFRPAREGRISIIKATSLTSGGYSVVATIDVPSADIDHITKYSVYIEVGEDDIIGINQVGDDAQFYYVRSGGDGFYGYVGDSNGVFAANFDLCVNWYVEI